MGKTGTDRGVQPPVPKGTGPTAVPQLVKRLQELADAEERVTLDQLTKEIGAQGHAPLLMVVAVLMVLPIGMIPGLGGALGAIAALIGLNMLLGRDGLWLPSFLARREIAAQRISATARRIRPAADWTSRHLHSRWESLYGARFL